MPPNIESAFKGSNAEVHLGNAGYYDSDSLDEGYTVIANVEQGLVNETDIDIV